MRKFIFLVVVYLTYFFLCPGANAQWEGAQVQRLTYNTSANDVVGLCIDKNDKLFLFYIQWKIDPHVQPYRDTLFLMTKEKDGEWSQPERISTPSLELCCGKSVDYDPYTGLIHLFYDCCDSVYSRSLYYTNSNIPNWEVVKIDSGTNQMHIGGMAFDTLGNIHLVWNVGFDSIGSSWYRVMYANNSTGQWVKHQVSPPIWLGGMSILGPYLGVEKNGTAHIVYLGEPYCDTQCVDFYVRNDSLNSTNWMTDTVPKPPRTLWNYVAADIEVDVNDRIHLVTVGCTIEYCGPWPGHWRSFYYYKQAEDSLWQGPELILDSLMDHAVIFIGSESVPYVAEWHRSTHCWSFTDRKQGFWREPYQILDTTYYVSSYYGGDFHFVLDSEGRGHGVFSGSLFEFMAQDDSLEIFYFGAPPSSVGDTVEELRKFSFELFQNHPNPFNQNTVIHYSLNAARPTSTTLKIYSILGKEVRELVNARQSSGNYTVIWDGKNNSGKEVGSGIYFYQLTVRQAHRPEQSRGRVGDYKETKKLVLIK